MTTIDTAKDTTTEMTVERDQELNYLLLLGADERVEKNVTVTLKRGARASIHAIVIGSEPKNYSLTISTIHSEPHTEANTTVRGIFGGKAKGLLTGTIVIPKNSQQTQAQLDERVLLISPDATADAIPNLEIEANDVTASHAATVSQLSDEDIFYLRSRCITKQESMHLLLHAFIETVLVHLEKSADRNRIKNQIVSLLKTV